MSAAKAGRLAKAAEALARDYRWWAAWPHISRVELQGLIVVSKDRIRRDVIGVVRPVFGPGVCVECGCTEADPCLDGDIPCGWANRARTRCTSCPPAQVATRRRRQP